MTEDNVAAQDLPLNFTQDFLFERRLLGQMLAFSSQNGCGDKASISLATGIPTGEKSGKVEPIIHYCRGMGLIHAIREAGEWHLTPTALGKVVREEDPYLNDSVTLWMLHLMLSRRNGLSMPAKGIADAWFSLFAEGAYRLGSPFELRAYFDYLAERHGKKSYLKGLASLVIRSYEETSCLGQIGALNVVRSGSELVCSRVAAPCERPYFPLYAAYFFLLWDDLFPAEAQIRFDDFSRESRFLSILSWDQKFSATWLDWMAQKGIVQIDRHTGSALVLRLQTTDKLIAAIYSELI